LQEFGEAIRQRYENNLVAKHVRTRNAAEAALDGDPGTFWTAPVGTHQAQLEVTFPSPITFDRSQTMEWLNNGQHIEHYRLEAWVGKGWKTLLEGQAIGHKRIDSFPAVSASRVRLNILSSVAEPAIREFQLFRDH
jgi:alpha-L-fucosidase